MSDPLGIFIFLFQLLKRDPSTRAIPYKYHSEPDQQMVCLLAWIAQPLAGQRAYHVPVHFNNVTVYDGGLKFEVSHLWAH